VLLQKIRAHLRGSLASGFAPSSRDAAVLMPIMESQKGPLLVLTRRAAHMNTHANEVAFPGGKVEPEDKSLIATALRESFEEIALPVDHVEVIGAMKSATSKHGLTVTPFIGVVPEGVGLLANRNELESIFYVPLQFFMDNPPTGVYEVMHQGHLYHAACYDYEGYVIWGLTAYFIADLFNQVFELDYDLSIIRAQKHRKK